ncbi:histidine phosphatase family protein [Pelomicrobium sp.]|jgi:phosphohistidine phosphatase SixA|uniref:histidine phosphatase family protein n=1 Tax=Pelomicrobium sp. TaxID=2815319 RepID=UPI002FDE70A5
MTRSSKRSAFALFLAVGLAAAASGADQETLWRKLQEGHSTLLVRHSLAPGTGDPENFQLEDCRTQRNLSPEGRAQARRIGEEFQRRQIPVGEVRSSRWCRCLETAQLAFGKADPWPALDSNYNDRAQRREDKNRAVLEYLLANPPRGGNRILVTHNYNIRDLTGVSPASGEMVVVEPDGTGGLRVLGTLTVLR